MIPGRSPAGTSGVHALTFALAATGFAAQMEFTVEQYGGKTMLQLQDEEEEDELFWWRRG